MKNQEVKNFISKLKRKTDTHKYDYGHILVVAGSKNMPGAGILACLGALRCGAGLVTYAAKNEFLNQVCAISRPEIMFYTYKTALDIVDFIKSKKVSSVVIGPGLQVGSDILRKFIKQILSLIDIPVVLDASGIACFNGASNELKNISPKLIITPHLGELSKLLNIKVDLIKNNREKIVSKFSKANSLLCVLKGSNTLVASHGKMYRNNTGTPAMATAGSGDVLSGMIASFVSITDDIFEASKFAVFVHGLAGEIAQKDKGQTGVISSDIAENICYAIKKLSQAGGIK
jgi:NAD(P)H-hydrate epimerase